VTQFGDKVRRTPAHRGDEGRPPARGWRQAKTRAVISPAMGMRARAQPYGEGAAEAAQAVSANNAMATARNDEEEFGTRGDEVPRQAIRTRYSRIAGVSWP